MWCNCVSCCERGNIVCCYSCNEATGRTIGYPTTRKLEGATMEEEQGERRRMVDDDIAVVFPKTWKLKTRQRCQRMGTCVVKKVGVLKWNKTALQQLEKNNNFKN